MKRRILSAFLSIALLVGLLPVGALAATGVEQHTDHTDWTAIAAEGGQLQTGNYYLSDDVKLTTDLTIPAGAEVTL